MEFLGEKHSVLHQNIDFMDPMLMESDFSAKNSNLGTKNSNLGNTNRNSELKQPPLSFKQVLGRTNLDLVNNLDSLEQSMPPPQRKGEYMSICVDPQQHLARIKFFDSALIGRLILYPGDRPWTLDGLRSKLQEIWKPNGPWLLSCMGKGFFTFRFTTIEERDRIWSIPLPSLKPGSLRLQRWTPLFNPYNQRSTTAQVWVRFYELGPEYYYPSFLWNLARCIGVPLKIDPRTLDGSLTHYARILIEVDLSKTLENHVMVEHGDGVCIFPSIGYERLPDFCKNCGVVGHSLTNCRKKDTQIEKRQQENENRQNGINWVRGRSRSRVRQIFQQKQQNLDEHNQILGEPDPRNVGRGKELNLGPQKQNLGQQATNLGAHTNSLEVHGNNGMRTDFGAKTGVTRKSWVEIMDDEAEEVDEEIEVESRPKEKGKDTGAVPLNLALKNSFAGLLGVVENEADGEHENPIYKAPSQHQLASTFPLAARNSFSNPIEDCFTHNSNRNPQEAINVDNNCIGTAKNKIKSARVVHVEDNYKGAAMPSGLHQEYQEQDQNVQNSQDSSRNVQDCSRIRDKGDDVQETDESDDNNCQDSSGTRSLHQVFSKSDQEEQDFQQQYPIVQESGKDVEETDDSDDNNCQDSSGTRSLRQEFIKNDQEQSRNVHDDQFQHHSVQVTPRHVQKGPNLQESGKDVHAMDVSNDNNCLDTSGTRSLGVNSAGLQVGARAVGNLQVHEESSFEPQTSDSSYNLRPRKKDVGGRKTSGKKKKGGRRF